MSIARMMAELSKMALAVPCPRCSAEAGASCVSVHPRKPTTPGYPVKPHQERKDAAVDARRKRRR